MKPQNMRLFFFIYLFTFFYFSSFSADFSPLERAEKLFENGLYAEASTLYDSLINKGLDSKEVLYKSAYIAERLGKEGEAIFYLRKIEKNYGNEEIQDRIRTLSEKIESEGVPQIENHPVIDRINRHTFAILLATIVILLGAIYLAFQKKQPVYRTFAISLFITSILIQILLVYFSYFQSPSLVIIKKSFFYENPSFASPYQNDLIAPGSVLEILEQKDIWYKIQYEQKEHWLPYFVVRKL